MFISRCWAAAGLPSDDVVRDAPTEEMSQAVFSASPLGALGGYIIRPTNVIVPVLKSVARKRRVKRVVIGGE
jgi:hypothetical protein